MPAHASSGSSRRIVLTDGWSGEVFDDAAVTAAWETFLVQLIRDPQRLPDYAPLKHSSDRRVIRAKVSSLGDRAVACRYVRTSGARAWLDCVRGSQARRDVRRAHAFLEAGLGTAKPWVVIERSRGVGESWSLSEFFPDAVDLDRIALALLPHVEAGRRRAVRAALASSLGAFFAKLELSGWRHRDLKASNLLIVHWDCKQGAPQVKVVDLEGLAPRRPWHLRARTQPLVRLAASLLDYPIIALTDHARFLRAYLRDLGKSESEWRSLFAVLRPQALHYARNAQGRKLHKLDGYRGA